MTFFDHLSFPPAFGPLALMSATILATVLLARPRRPHRRTGLPKGRRPRTENAGALQQPNNLFFPQAVKRQTPTALASPRPLAA